MKIRNLFIGGFGVFREYRVELAPAGITIFLGPNEAGKSTLLAFIKAMLFGFQPRSRAPRYPPLHGGSHIGRLFVDTRDGAATVERNFQNNTLLVTLDDGSPVNDGRFRNWLGQADETMFGSLYAFSLLQLASMESLEHTGVREWIYSAGAHGAGMSGVEVSEKLKRPINDLFNTLGKGEIGELDGQLGRVTLALANARQQASTLAELIASEETANRELRACDAEMERVRAELGELEKLERARTKIIDQRTASAELTAFPLPNVALAEHEAAYVVLEHKRALHSEWVKNERLDRTAYDQAHQDLEQILHRIGPDWTRQRVDNLSLLPGVDAEVEACDRQLRDGDQTIAQTATAQSNAADHLKTARQDREFRETAVARTVVPDHAVLPPIQDADTRGTALSNLVIALEQEQQLLENDERSLREGIGSAGTASAMGATPAYFGGLVLAIGLLGVIASILVLPSSTRFIVAALFGLVGCVALVLLVFGLRTRAKQAVHIAAAGRVRKSADDRRVRLQLLREQAEPMAGALGWPTTVPTPAMIAARMQQWRDASQQVAERLAAEHELDVTRITEAHAIAALDDAKDAGSQAQAALESMRKRWRDVLAKNALDASLSPPDAMRLINELRGARRSSEDIDRQTEKRREHAARIEAYEVELQTWLTVTGEPTSQSGEALLRCFDEVGTRVRAAATAVREKEALAAQCTTLSLEVELILGAGDALDGIRRQLSEGTAVDVILSPLPALRLRHGGLIQQHDKLLEAEVRAKTNRERLEVSHDVNDLAMQHGELEAQRVQFRRRWLVLQIARVLLDETQARYERENRPAVLERAGALFGRATGGKYPRLEVNESGLKVVDEFGGRHQPEQLSRGTAELLYLCMRFGVLGEGSTAPLPVVMDDVLVNLDAERAEGAVMALAEFAAQRQVVYFTCHQHTMALLQRHVPHAHVVNMERYGGRDVAAAQVVPETAAGGSDDVSPEREAQAAAVLACLRAAGERLGKQEIAQRTGLPDRDWKSVIQILIDNGHATFEGEKRGRRYWAC